MATTNLEHQNRQWIIRPCDLDQLTRFCPENEISLFKDEKMINDPDFQQNSVKNLENSAAVDSGFGSQELYNGHGKLRWDFGHRMGLVAAPDLFHMRRTQRSLSIDRFKRSFVSKKRGREKVPFPIVRRLERTVRGSVTPRQFSRNLGQKVPEIRTELTLDN